MTGDCNSRTWIWLARGFSKISCWPDLGQENPHPPREGMNCRVGIASSSAPSSECVCFCLPPCVSPVRMKWNRGKGWDEERKEKLIKLTQKEESSIVSLMEYWSRYRLSKIPVQHGLMRYSQALFLNWGKQGTQMIKALPLWLAF